MQYRKYGKQGYDVSLFGMGCMRLPRRELADGSIEIDKEKAFELIRYAADNGVTYFDTAFTYHNSKSEDVLGEALEGRRDKVKIVTKQRLPSMQGSKDIMRKNLELTLKKLRTDHLDVYLVHNINAGEWQGILDLGVIEEFEKFKAEGMIKAIGFSYHGKLPLFKEVLNHYDWAMCQVQQNLLDCDKEVTDEAFEIVGQKGCAMVVMEPLRGGGLSRAPGDVMDIYDQFEVKRSPAEWAFRYLIDKPQVSTILSGVTTMEQLKDNIRIFSAPDAVPGCLTESDRKILAEAKAAYESRTTIPCTGCEYCMPCPQGVNIPGVFAKYNEGSMFEAWDNAQRSYMFTKAGNADAGQCVACGACMPHCPQNINIIEELKVSHAKLDGWRES